MKLRKKHLLILIPCLIALLVLLGIAGIFLFLQNLSFGFARQVSAEEADLRMQVVETAEKWLDCKESDQSYAPIIDIYNQHQPLAQGYLVQPDDNWCATFGSAVAIECNLTDIIPTECSCERQINLFAKLGCWQEDDAYVPLPGDYIFYSIKNPSLGDSTAWSDHVGIVVGTCLGYMKVIEGNNGDKVAYRYIPVNDPSIRGYGLPDYSAKCN